MSAPSLRPTFYGEPVSQPSEPVKPNAAPQRPSERPARPAHPADAVERDGPGVVRRTTNTAKRVLLVAIGALVALFAVFNSQEVEVKWIFGNPIQTPLILALALTFVAGAAVGWLWAKLGGRGNAAK